MIFSYPCKGQLLCFMLAAVGIVVIVVKQVNSLLDRWTMGSACLNAIFSLINRLNFNKKR